MALDPLKFSVAIEGNAISELDAIETKLKGLKDSVKIPVTIEGMSNFQKFLTAIVEAKTAIKNDDFGKFAMNISKAATEFDRLNVAFEKFHLTIGSNEGMKNFMEGLGATIQKVQNTMGSLKGRELGLTGNDVDVYAKNVEKVADAINRLEQLRQRAMTAMSKGGSSGDMWQWLDAIEKYQQKLGAILSNPDIMSGKFGADVFGANFKDLFRVVGEMEKMANQYAKAQEAMQKAVNMSSASAAQGKVSLMSTPDTENILKTLRELQQIQHLAGSSRYGNISWFRDMTNLQNMDPDLAKKVVEAAQNAKNIGEFRVQLDALYATYEKFASLQPVDLGRKLGIEHLKGYTGPATAADDVTWAAMKHQAEVQEVAGEAAKRHQRKLEELTNAFAQYDAQVAKAQRVQDGDNQARQQSVHTLRKQAEELVNVRMEMLRSQSADLGKLLSLGRDKLGYEQYDAIRDALRAVRNEMSQIETVMQRMGSYSTRELFTVGRGTTMDYSPLITNTQKWVKSQEDAARASNELTDKERMLAQALKDTNHEAKSQTNLLNELKSLAMQYLGVWGAQQFLHNIIQIGGQLESQRMSLTAILGQASYANDLFANIQSMALKSPFGVVQLDQYSKQLSAFGFEYNELFDTTNRLANIAAGTGTDFGRLALAIGHVRSELALTGYTLRQFSMANVPMLKKLSENLGVTTQQVRKMVREKKVSYEDVMQVIKELTDEGGIFYNMQEVMSEAVSAKFKNLKDSMDIMYGQIAESKVGDFLKWVAESLMEVTKRWKAFGTVIGSTLAVIGLYRMAMTLASNAQRAASTNLLQNAIFTKQATAADIEQLIAKKQLTVQDVALALAQGKLNVSQAQGILMANNYTQAMIDQIVATQGLKGAFVGMGSAMKSALLNPMTLTLIAIEGVVATAMAYYSWSSKIQDDAQRYAESQKAALQETSKYLKEAQESGKPTDNLDLSAEVEQMTTILKNSGLYTEELEHQVNLAPSLSDEYDILIEKMRTSNEMLKNMGLNSELIADSIKSTSTSLKNWTELRFLFGGIPTNLVAYWGDLVQGKNPLTGIKNRVGGGFDFLFNDDLNKNVDDLQKSMDALSRKMAGLNEYRENMQSAIDTMIKSGKHVEMANYPLEEQIRILAEDGDAWDEFVNLAGRGSEDFEKHAKNVREAAKDVASDWKEITEDDVPKMIEKLKEEYETDEAGLLKMYMNNEHNFRNMLDGILASAKEKSPQIYEALMAMLPDFLRGQEKGWIPSLYSRLETPAQKKAREEREKLEAREKTIKGYGTEGAYAMKTLTSWAKANGLGDAKGNGVFDIGFVGKYFKSGVATKEGFDAISKDFKKARDEYEAAVKTGNALEIAKTKAEYELLDHAMDAFDLDKSDKNHKSTTKKGEDVNAKAVREKVRVMKEAADAYKYWRDKVGDAGAWVHVNEEFGEVLSKIGVTADNVNDLRSNLDRIQKSPEYAAIRDEKVKTEIDKEIAKEKAQLNRSDFEKDTEDFLSKTQRQIEDLTQKWEMFNSVISATGDNELAKRLTGIKPGATIADLKRYNIGQNIGNIVDFKKVLSMSDEEVKRYVESLGIPEEKINGIVESLKDWKKAQQDVTKSDIENYAKWLGGLMDVQSQRNRNEREYQAIVEETTRLLQLGVLSQEEAEKRIATAAANRDHKNFQLTSTYANLYNNAQAMSAGEFYGAFNTELDSLRKKFESGEMSAHDYAEEVDKLNKIERAFVTANKFLGIGGSVGAFLSGGQSGLSEYYRSKAKKALEDGDEKEAEKYKERADTLDDEQKTAEDVVKAFQEVAGAANLLAGLFDSLGMEGAAGALSDVGNVLGGAVSGAQSLSAFGPWGMAAGAAIGGLTSVVQMGDKKQEAQIEALRQDVQRIGNTLNTIRALRERTLGYDSGDARRKMYEQYMNTNSKRNVGPFVFNNAAVQGMQEYYSRGLEGTGYRQELESLKTQREDYLKMYNAETGKKKSSAAALEEYKAKISELDEQIKYFGEDIAKELWDIDFKGWADQISDALMTAFENGENAAKAFKESVQKIMQSVVSNILRLQIIEPMMEKLEKVIFGGTASNGKKYKGVTSTEKLVDNPEQEIKKIIKTINTFMDKEGTATIEAYGAAFNAMNNALGGALTDKTGSSAKGGITSITEQTADILASYLNATRADVSLIREMQTTYFEDFKRAITDSNSTLMQISQHTNAIMISNEQIADYVESMEDMFRGLRNDTWRLPVS